MIHERSILASFGCCLLLLGGCDGAPPSAPDDPDADVAAMAAAISNIELTIGTPAMHSLGIVGSRMIIAGTAAPASTGLAVSSCGPGRTATTHHAPLTTHLFTGLIADSLFHRVYAYDAPSRSYLPTAAGNGPANGVRFLLDDLDAFGQPTTPPAQVGWLDLTDESAGGIARLHALVRNASATNADYLVTPTGSQGNYAARQSGRAVLGSSAFQFSDSVAAAGQEINAVATLDSAAPGVRMSLRIRKINFDAADFRYELDLSATRGSQTFRLVGANVVFCYFGAWDVAVTQNDTALATYARNVSGTTVTVATGRILTEAQSRLITDLMDLQQLLFDWFQALFAPVQRLLPP